MLLPQRISFAVRNADVEQRDPSAGAHDPAEFGEESRQLDEVAQGKSARRTVDGVIGQGQSQDVGLHPGRTAAVGGEHPEAEVERQRPVSLAGQVDAKVAGTAGQVDHCARPWQIEQFHRLASPAHVEAEGHDPVDEVVSRRDGIEHLTNSGHLVVTFGQASRCPMPVCSPAGGYSSGNPAPPIAAAAICFAQR